MEFNIFCMKGYTYQIERVTYQRRVRCLVWRQAALPALPTTSSALWGSSSRSSSDTCKSSSSSVQSSAVGAPWRRLRSPAYRLLRSSHRPSRRFSSPSLCLRHVSAVRRSNIDSLLFWTLRPTRRARRPKSDKGTERTSSSFYAGLTGPSVALL